METEDRGPATESPSRLTGVFVSKMKRNEPNNRKGQPASSLNSSRTTDIERASASPNLS